MLQNYIIQFDVSNQTFYPATLDEIRLDEENAHIIYWIHCDLNNVKEFNRITQKLNLPTELVILCKDQNALPKLIENNESLIMLVECLLDPNFSAHTEIPYGNLIIFLTKKYCLTASFDDLPPIIEFNNNFHKYLNFAKTPCFILFLMMDNIINNYSKLLLNFELLADQIDLKARETEKLDYNQVMAIKNQVMRAQHHTAAIRDMLMRISGRMVTVISKPCRLSLLNLLDHTKIIFNEAEAIRDILKNTLDQLDNALMQRLNKTMKVLTAFNAIFLPLSLVAGIYGMNFHWIPELQWSYGYFWALGLMLIIAIFLFIIFKIKEWI